MADQPDKPTEKREAPKKAEPAKAEAPKKAEPAKADPEVLAKRSAELREAGKAGEALTVAERALQADLSHPAARAAHGLALLALGRTQDAADALAAAFELGSASDEIAVSAGRALAASGDKDRAIEVLELHVGATPGAPEAKELLLRLSLHRQRYGRAVDLGRLLVKAHPEVGRYWGLLGIAAEQAGDEPEAREAYGKALENPPVEGLVAQYARSLGYV